MADKDIVSLSQRADKPGTNEEVAAIPLVEERLEVTTRPVEAGRIRVHVAVEERQEKITHELLRDDVEIERVPRNIPLTEMPHVRLEGATTIVPVVEEVVVVEKKLMLVDEIHIRRQSGSEVREIPVTVRSEQAIIERDGVPTDLNEGVVPGLRSEGGL